ncbi:MAG: hypothetical protein JKY48_06985 [Flavobacteriales bacterium]|nr:hypothetical protein [Flavobacteriales bacterium]
MELDLPKNLEKILLKTAENFEKKPSDLVADVLRGYFEDLADYRDGIVGYQSYLASGKKGTSISEMRERLGLTDA